jgi:hypothetical protein
MDPDQKIPAEPYRLTIQTYYFATVPLPGFHNAQQTSGQLIPIISRVNTGSE